MTGKPAWTPGPWVVDSEDGGLCVFADGEQIASVEVERDRDCLSDEAEAIAALWKKQNANAALIASAPDLYEALYYAETVMLIVEPRSHKGEYLACLKRARAALAKARGEQP
jgi:hypothetical protein